MIFQCPLTLLDRHQGLFGGLLIYLGLQCGRGNSPAVDALFLGLYGCLIAGYWRWAQARLGWGSMGALIALTPLIWAQIQLRAGSRFRTPTSGRKTALFSLADFTESKGTNPTWNLSGDLTFSSKAADGNSNVSCLRIRLRVPPKFMDLKSGSWLVSGTLRQRPFSSIWTFQLDKSPPRARPQLYSRLRASWAMARQWAKARVERRIRSCLPNTRARAFIIGLCTGRQSDARLNYALGKVGLSHLLAVSGFHFACVIGACEALMSKIPHRRAAMFPLVTALMYFAYMGPTASVFRAMLMSVERLRANWLGNRHCPLNALGWSLGLWCLLWPDCSREIGFSLSYLCTAALLLLAAPLGALGGFLWPDARAWRWGRLRAFCASALCANASAHLVTALPLIYLWHMFPIASLWYNLFVPPLVGLAMQVLLAACLTIAIPPISSALFQIAHLFLAPIVTSLEVTRPWECQWWGECSQAAMAWTTAFLLGGGLWYYAKHEQKSPLERWIF